MFVSSKIIEKSYKKINRHQELNTVHFKKNLSSVVECHSEQFDSISLTTASSSVADSPPSIHKFTTEQITRLLKTDSSNYKAIKNAKSNLFSVCWKLFGFPVKKSHVKAEFEQIPGFVSCQSCFQTYTFTSSFGTRILNAHSCVQKLSSCTKKRSSLNNGNASQMKLTKVMKCYKQVQLPEKEINLVKDLTCKWLCQDMRAFSIVEDIGLRNLLQEFIILGKYIFLMSSFLLNICFFLIFRCYVWRN